MNCSTILRRLMKTNSTMSCLMNLLRQTKNCSMSFPRPRNCCWRNYSMKSHCRKRKNCWRRMILRWKSSMRRTSWDYSMRNLVHWTKTRNRHWNRMNCCSTRVAKNCLKTNCWMTRRWTKNCWTNLLQRSLRTSPTHRSTNSDLMNCSNWTTGFRSRNSTDWTNCCWAVLPRNCSVAARRCCYCSAAEARRCWKKSCLKTSSGPCCSKNCQIRNYWMADRPTNCSRAETRCSMRVPKMGCYTIRSRT